MTTGTYPILIYWTIKLNLHTDKHGKHSTTSSSFWKTIFAFNGNVDWTTLNLWSYKCHYHKVITLTQIIIQSIFITDFIKWLFFFFNFYIYTVISFCGFCGNLDTLNFKLYHKKLYSLFQNYFFFNIHIFFHLHIAFIFSFIACNCKWQFLISDKFKTNINTVIHFIDTDIQF